MKIVLLKKQVANGNKMFAHARVFRVASLTNAKENRVIISFPKGFEESTREREEEGKKMLSSDIGRVKGNCYHSKKRVLVRSGKT